MIIDNNSSSCCVYHHRLGVLLQVVSTTTATATDDAIDDDNEHDVDTPEQQQEHEQSTSIVDNRKMKQLIQWNDDFEYYIAKQQQHDKQHEEEEEGKEMVEPTSTSSASTTSIICPLDHNMTIIPIFVRLYELFIQVMQGNKSSDVILPRRGNDKYCIMDNDDTAISTNTLDVLDTIIQLYKDRTTIVTAAAAVGGGTNPNVPLVQQQQQYNIDYMIYMIRTIKNWWRYYIQYYIPTIHYSNSNININTSVYQQDCIISTIWRSQHVLELLLYIMEDLSTRTIQLQQQLQQQQYDKEFDKQQDDDNNNNGHPQSYRTTIKDGIQYCVQLFFYITYPLSLSTSPTTNSSSSIIIHQQEAATSMDQVYQYMISECNIMKRFLILLINHHPNRKNYNQQNQKPQLLLQLSIIRNIHNALVSYPHQSMSAMRTASVINYNNHNNNTNDDDHDDSNNIRTTVTYTTIFQDLALYILSNDTTVDHDLNESNKSDIGSRNTNTSSINVELLLEILRCCYVLRIGQLDNTDNNISTPNAALYTDLVQWQSIIEQVLQRNTGTSTNSNNNHNFTLDKYYYECKLVITCILMESVYLRQHLSSSSFQALLPILDEQVTIVLQKQYIDDRASATLNPILAVLYKLCIEQPNTFAHTLRMYVFPNMDHDNIHSNETDQQQLPPRNMSPIDAPINTIRWKLIQLVTWPNSYIKRLCGELLYILCYEKQHILIRYVGMGNAVQLLSVKGLLDLPSSVHS